MLASGRRAGRAAIACLLTLLIGGCVGGGAAVLNKPLAPEALSDSGPISRGGYRPAGLEKGKAPEVLVLISFSGGGKRSAAFGYGVLKGLRDYPVVIDGETRPLLDEVGMMASVSGGSFPAAYYGLYHDGLFTNFEKDFLDQDIEAYIYGTYLLPWHLNWWVDPDFGTNDRMAEVYDKLMFHGATFADLAASGKPFVSIDATDIDHETAFAFMQDQFDLICSDLSSYPLSRAVAASNGFPVLFSPITLKSFRPQCGGRVPAWVAADKADNDPLDRVHVEAQIARKYLDADATRWVHLFDGGIVDNLAMRNMIDIMMVVTGDEDSNRFDLTRTRRILLISADGQAANNAASAKQKHLSGLGQVFNAVSGTQIDAYNFETLELARRTLDKVRDAVVKQRCAVGPNAADGRPCDDVKTYFAHLSLAGVADEAERKRLQQIPTGLTLDKSDVDRLIVAGQSEVMGSPDIRTFRDSLR